MPSVWTFSKVFAPISLMMPTRWMMASHPFEAGRQARSVSGLKDVTGADFSGRVTWRQSSGCAGDCGALRARIRIMCPALLEFRWRIFFTNKT